MKIVKKHKKGYIKEKMDRNDYQQTIWSGRMTSKSIDEMTDEEFDEYMEQEYPEIMKIIDKRIRSYWSGLNVR